MISFPQYPPLFSFCVSRRPVGPSSIHQFHLILTPNMRAMLAKRYENGGRRSLVHQKEMEMEVEMEASSSLSSARTAPVEDEARSRY